MPDDSYNPDNLGQGGFLATAPCGCTMGWMMEVISDDDMHRIADYLLMGCKIEPVARDAKITRQVCERHKTA